MTTLFIFSGLPGSGKSTLAKLVAQRFNALYLRIDNSNSATTTTGIAEIVAADEQREAVLDRGIGAPQPALHFRKREANPLIVERTRPRTRARDEVFFGHQVRNRRCDRGRFEQWVTVDDRGGQLAQRVHLAQLVAADDVGTVAYRLVFEAGLEQCPTTPGGSGGTQLEQLDVRLTAHRVRQASTDSGHGRRPPGPNAFLARSRCARLRHVGRGA